MIRPRRLVVEAGDVDAHGCTAALVLALIRYRSNLGPYRASHAELAEHTGITRRQAQYAIGKLVDAGALETSKPGAHAGDHTTEYRIAQPCAIESTPVCATLHNRVQSIPLSREPYKSDLPVQVDLFNETDKARAGRRGQNMSESHGRLLAMREGRR